MTIKFNLESKMGIKSKTKAVSPGDLKSEPDNRNFTKTDFLKILDLFSGTGSWVEGWRKTVSYNCEIDSIDIIKKDHVNFCMDFLDFKPTKEYHIVYASIPCTHFSQIKQINKKRTTDEELKHALLLAKETFHIAKKAKFCYVIENPQTGKLKNYYSGYQTVDYSEYGYPLRKRTALWSNIDLKLKTKTEIKYNQKLLQSLPKDDKWKIPKKLSDHVKWMIIKKFNRELQQFKKGI